MLESNTVISFLRDFKTKMEIWGIVFLDERAKNTQALAILELSTTQRTKIIKDLKLEDYSQGPITDGMFLGNDLWVFGKEVKQQEVYIKISIGMPSKQAICISFHLAEHAMKFPFKKINK